MYRFLCLGLLALLLGCGPRPTKGGTPGTFQYGGLPSLDVQIHLHRPPAMEHVGFGITTADGKFQLVTSDAKGPLFLSPGEYIVTLESIGTDPVYFPAEYAHPTTSPLRRTWSASDTSLDIQIPAPTLNESPVPR